MLRENLLFFLPGLFTYSYIARLEDLKPKPLEEWRITNDVMFLFKIMHKQVDVDFDNFFCSTTIIIIPKVTQEIEC